MKINRKSLVVSVLIPLGVGAISSMLSFGGMAEFSSLQKPPLSPPALLFPIVWTLLYILMGIASYIVSESQNTYRAKTALCVYGVQLFFNFFWSILFFRFEQYVLSFAWLLVLWLLVILTAALFFKLSRVSGMLLLPYVIWVTFAAYLNFGIAVLNT